MKASEDKTFPGAIVAGLASPWGQAVPAGNETNGHPTYFGSYREVFSRDLYEAFTALLVAGDVRSARDADLFLFERQQQPDGSMPRNSLLNGMLAPDTGGLQLDETSYPILMDWQSGLAGDTSLYRQHVIPAADFLVAHGPSDGNERWEEQSGYSRSTIAAEIAGLTAAARIAAVHGDAARSAVYQATADEFARNIKRWTVTTTGPYAPSYFIRLSKSGDPNAADTLNLGNGSITVDQRTVVDAGFLELVRLGVLPASDPTVRASLGVIDATVERSTPSGPGFYRYTVTATLGHSTGYAQLSVTNVALPGTVVLTATDPSGDDNGPGTYAYPTDSSFSPGAFDLLGLQVSQTTSDVYIQAKIRNLASTFGSNFGAQLLDVYVRDPAAASHSTTAAFAQRNYTIAPVDAWSERLEAQGFSFGVCTSGASSPICSVDPSTVPKVMDTVTPAGVSQGAELDPTHGPVSLQGVAVP